LTSKIVVEVASMKLERRMFLRRLAGVCATGMARNLGIGAASGVAAGVAATAGAGAAAAVFDKLARCLTEFGWRNWLPKWGCSSDSLYSSRPHVIALSLLAPFLVA
jgi:hypothetical protein